MHFRKLLLATGASVAAGALALAPAAQATTPTGTAANYVSVGGNSTTANHPITGTLKAGGSVTMKVFGSAKTLNCTSGSVNGTVHGGPTGGVTYKAASFSALTLNCDSFLPGQTVTISVPANGCAGFKVNDTRKNSVNVHDGLVDSGIKGGKLENVYGVIDVPSGAGCPVTVTTSGGCTLQLGDFIKAQFDEAIKPNGTQDLALEGNDLTIKSTSGACLGAVSAGQQITMNNLRFNIASPDGSIDFRTNP